ncbi:unnamed protein product, partial [Owenia fusiformis]
HHSLLYTLIIARRVRGIRSRVPSQRIQGIRMVILAVFLGLLVAVSGQFDDPIPRVDTVPDDCVAFNGLVPYEDSPGGDCCHFIQCDASNANKTGFLFKCVYPLVWNREIPACDEDTNVAGACIHTDCSTEPEPKLGCVSNEAIKDEFGPNFCCLEGEDAVYEALIDVSPAEYRVRYVEGEFTMGNAFDTLRCPRGQQFSSEDCCCETEVPHVPECEEAFYFQSPGDDCCTYHQCWPNKTGFWDVTCMGSVWNQKILNCDDPSLVDGCENADCIMEMTEKVCPDKDALAAEGKCCAQGQVYIKDLDDPFEDGSAFYVGDEQKFDYLAFCPVGQVFQLDCCCCYGMILYTPECDCIEFSFEPDYLDRDQLQNVSIINGDAVVLDTGELCGANVLVFDGDDVATVDYFARNALGGDFTFSFAADGSGSLLSNGAGSVAPTLECSVGGSSSCSFTFGGEQINLSGPGGQFVTVVRSEEGKSISLYVDGSLADTQPAAGRMDTTDCPLKIGEGFVGAFDSLVFCTFAYDEAQVSGLANCNVAFDARVS